MALRQHLKLRNDRYQRNQKLWRQSLRQTIHETFLQFQHAQKHLLQSPDLTHQSHLNLDKMVLRLLVCRPPWKNLKVICSNSRTTIINHPGLKRALLLLLLVVRAIMSTPDSNGILHFLTYGTVDQLQRNNSCVQPMVIFKNSMSSSRSMKGKRLRLRTLGLEFPSL